jgi:hypothetical protein
VLGAIAHLLLRQSDYEGEPMEHRAYRIQTELAAYVDQLDECESGPG